MHAMPDQNQHTSWKSTCFRTDFLPNSRIWGYAAKSKVINFLFLEGRVCVPISMADVDSFDPFTVPTIRFGLSHLSSFFTASLPLKVQSLLGASQL